MNFENNLNTPIVRTFNLPRIPIHAIQQDQSFKIDACFSTSSPQNVFILGPRGSGKTTTCLGYIQSRKFNTNQLIVFLNADKPDKLDFEYRQFAFELFGMSIYKTRRDELIEYVNGKLRNHNILYIFDNVQNLDDLKAYFPINSYNNKLNQTNRQIQTIITSSNMSLVDEKSNKAVVYQSLLGKEEATLLIKSKVDVKTWSYGEINDFVKNMGRARKSGEITASDVEKCRLFINNANLSKFEKIKAIKMHINIIDVILKYIVKIKCNFDLLVALSMLDHNRVPLRLLAEIFPTKSLTKDLKEFEKYALVQVRSDSTNRYVRMEKCVSDQIFKWTKNNLADRLGGVLNLLLVKIDQSLTLESKKNLDEIYQNRFFYPHVCHLLTVNSIFQLINEASVRLTMMSLCYKRSLLEFSFMCNHKQAFKILDNITALNLSDSVLSEKFHAKVLLAMGECYDQKEDLENAILEKNRALRIQKKARITKDCIETLESLSKSYCKRGMMTKALDFQIEAMEIKSDPNTHWKDEEEKITSLAHSHYNLGRIKMLQKDFEVAKQHFKSSYEMRKKFYPKNNNIDLLYSLQGLDKIYELLGQDKKANNYNREAHGVMRNIQNDYINQKKNRFTILAIFSNIQLTIRYDKLESKYNQHETTLVREKTNSKIFEGKYEYNRGLEKMIECNYKDAVKRFSIALENFQKSSSSSSTIQEMNCHDNMAVCYVKLSNFTEAHKHIVAGNSFRKDHYTSQWNPDMLISFNLLADYYDASEEFVLADEYREKAAQVCEYASLTKDKEYAKALNDVGVKYKEGGQYEMAMYYIEQAYIMYERITGCENQPEKMNLLCNLAMTNYKTKQIEEAIRMAHLACDMHSNFNEIISSNMADTVNLLGVLYFEKMDYRNAEAYFLKAYEMRVNINNDGPKIADSYFNLGRVYQKLGNHQMSDYYFTKCHEIGRSFYGTENKN